MPRLRPFSRDPSTDAIGHFQTQIAAAGIAKRQTIVAASAPITISLLTHIAITSRDRPS
jgi:hypothetical protein